ncbi:restriction endonuclease subunit S [Intestinibacter bartlettii]|uniref:restriction endonuclease subunit S n=1 Tax=Intestinibacter bartlettii TaxID=261299 RepID=UPI003522BC8D
MEYRYRDASEMKDSGVEWIGKIPKYWEINKLKNISSIYGRIGFRGYTVNDLVSEGEGAITLSPSNIEEQKLKLDKLTYISWEKYEESPEIKVYNEDIVFVKTASVGKVAYIEGLLEKATINPQFVVFKNIKMNKKLLYYILVSNVIQEQINSGINGGVVSTLTQQDINNYYIPYQNNIEQEKIANFLDKKTLQFDSIISKKEALIEKLEEAKKSLISEVVTGKVKVVKTDDGYELVKRSSEEMKDSGVEWLGEIPKNWEVKKLKYVASLKSGDSITSNNIKDEGIYPVYGGNGLRGYTSNYTHSGKYILIGRQGALCGNINYASNEFWASEHAVVVNPVIEVNLTWLGELLRSMNLNQYSVSAAQPGLAVGMIENLYIPYTSIKIQNKIAAYIDEKIKNIEYTINKTKQQIEKLKEAKQSLISEAVTGKIEILD